MEKTYNQLNKRNCYPDIIEVYVSLLIAVIIFRGYSQFTNDILYYPAFLMGACLFVYCGIKYRINIKIILVIILFIFLVLINGIVNDSNSYMLTVYAIGTYYPISLFFLYRRKFSVAYWYLFFIIMMVCLFLIMINSVDGYLLFYETSRNYVSVFSFVIFFTCIVAAEKNNKTIPLIMPVIMFLLATYSVGRGGIISTFFMLVLYAIYRIAKKERNKRNVFLILVVIVILTIGSMIMISKSDYIINNFFPRLGGENTAGSNTERIMIYETYFEGIKNAPIQQVLFGLTTDRLGGPFGRVDWNIHNSYFQSFATIGLVGIIIFGVLIVKVIIYLYRRKKFDSLFFLLAFMLRAGTDYVFPCYIGDVVIVYYAFLIWAQDDRNKAKLLASNSVK